MFLDFTDYPASLRRFTLLNRLREPQFRKVLYGTDLTSAATVKQTLNASNVKSVTAVYSGEPVFMPSLHQLKSDMIVLGIEYVGIVEAASGKLFQPGKHLLR